MGEVVAWLVGIGVFVLGLAASIALHEVGHLVPAKAFGVKVTQYMVGFGPTLWSRRRGETEYGVKAVPLGGYVRMVGMYAPLAAVVEERAEEDAAGAAGVDDARRRRRPGYFAEMAREARAAAADEVEPGEEHRSFHRLPVGKRVVVMLGGPFVNLVLATVLLGAYLTTTGLPETVPVVSSVSQCVLPASSARTTCSASDPESPAAQAGLRPGDRILSVDGVAADGDWSRVQRAIRGAADRTVAVVVERGSGGSAQRLELQAPIIANDVARTTAAGAVVTTADGAVVTDRVGFLGVTPSAEVVPQPVTAVPGFVLDSTWQVAKIVLTLPQRMVGVAQAAFGSGERDPNGPIGIVGVGRLSGEIASSDLFTSTGQRVSAIVSILGSLNLALFVFNLVPLLPLDGGHVVGALWEGARRRVASWRGRPDPGPFDLAKLLPVTYAVTVVLIGMSVLLLYADVVRPITLG